VARRHVQDIAAPRHEYRVTHGGTMDGTNCRSPIGGGFAIWEQTWESNRAVRLENVGETDVINPWLSNGRNNFRSMQGIIASAVRPGMSDREKALALWRLHATHRFHASSGDNEVNDPVKVFNVYGYTTCGNDSICLAGLWRALGFPVRPARCPGHCISQVFFDGRWNLLDGDMGPFYLLRDNATIASEQDLVRDHDLLKRSHTAGILDPDSRAAAEGFAALFVSDAEWDGTRSSVRDTTMNMVLRPNEALVWSWGHRVPVKYHGRLNIKVFGPRSGDGKVWGGHAADRICNGRWEYRPDFRNELWRQGAEQIDNVQVERGELVPAAAKTGTITWKMRSPYPFVGGNLDVDGTGARFALSWDGSKWQEIDESLEAFFHFPHKGDARYAYWLRCELPAGARLKRLAIGNDLQMAPLALPALVVGENRFTYTDESPGPRQVRLTHEWVERSLSRPPQAPAAPVFPPDGGQTDRTDIAFQWQPAQDPDGDTIADYHFQLADRADLAWPLSSNFEKLIANTADRGQAQYRLPHAGLLTPGQTYYWRVRARDAQGVWGPWSPAWKFTAGGLAPPVEVSIDCPSEQATGILRWKPNPAGRRPVRYRVYGSDEKGFSVSDEPYRANGGPRAKDRPALFPANFVAETTQTELTVLGRGLTHPLANSSFYRVVAVDAQGQRSGASDYATAPRPFVYSELGTPYRYQAATVASRGDLRVRTVDGRPVADFWDTEKPRFTLTQGPAWLRIDESTGLLSGTPDAAGTAEVVIAVTLERPLRRLDDSRLSWGHESVLGVGTEKVGTATQRFPIAVAK
jgi:hypothetical protein